MGCNASAFMYEGDMPTKQIKKAAEAKPVDVPEVDDEEQQTTSKQANPVFLEMFPGEILGPHNERVSTSDLNHKVIGFYFGAHWCGPCRQFAPKLIKWYNHFKATHKDKDKFELVFVSADNNEAAFNEYRKEMTFHALPFEDRELPDRLRKHFNVQGIPALIFVDDKGEKYVSDGRKIVTEDEFATGFPWKPKTVTNALANHFVNNQQQQYTMKSLGEKHIALFFGSPKDAGSRAFSKRLINLYDQAAVNGSAFEVVFVSTGHKTKREFDDFFKEMPWWAIPSNFKQRRAELVEFFDIESVPSLVVLDYQLNILTKTGVAEVEEDPYGNSISWLHRGDSGAKENRIVKEFLPEFILDAKNQQVRTAKALTGKYIGIYFGGHWCGPCRQFCPLLTKWFARFKKEHEQSENFELLFVSWDKTEEAFNEYRKEMNFHALAYSERAIQAKLCAEFGVRGIPAFVIIDEEGNVINRDAKKAVTEDEKAAKFPWRPETFPGMLGTTFLKSDGSKQSLTDFKDKYVALYFASKASLPCKGFTPQLIKLYNTLKAANKPFEVIFVSQDKDQASYDSHFAEMPWLAVESTECTSENESPAKHNQTLTEHFQIKDLPAVVLLTPDLKVITADGRRILGADLDGAKYPWIPKALNPLDDAAMAAIDEFPFLLAITDGSEDEVADAIEAIKDTAEAEFAKDDPKLNFFYVADPDEEILDLTRKAVRLAPTERLVILDMVYGKKYVAPDQSLTPDNVASFVKRYLQGTIVGIAAKK